MEQPPREIKQPSLLKAVIRASVLVFLDAFLLNQGIFSIFFGLFLLVISVPRSFLLRFRPVRVPRLRNIAIYLAAALLVIVFNNLNNRMAFNRAEQLIAAIDAYHAAHDRYPQKLEDLVPEFIGKVPAAKYALANSSFYYRSSSGDSASLFYVSVPPFGRPIYHFPQHRWGYLD